MIYFDIEADGLLYAATKIHCIVAYDDAKNMYHIFVSEPCIVPANTQMYETVNDFLSFMNKQECICSFNGVGFDLPLLKKLHGYEYSLDKQIDCLILSRLYYPDRSGHSLAYFGQLLGFHKGNHSDWSQFSQEMLDYCIQDVLVLQKTYNYLTEEGKDWDWSEAVKLEKKIQDIQVRQELKGVLFDSAKAVVLSATIGSELATLEEKIMVGLPKIVKQVGATVDRPFTKSGKLSKNVEGWLNSGDDYV